MSGRMPSQRPLPPSSLAPHGDGGRFAAPRFALGALVEEHADFVWRSLRRLGVPEAMADDATQQVFRRQLLQHGPYDRGEHGGAAAEHDDKRGRYDRSLEHAECAYCNGADRQCSRDQPQAVPNVSLIHPSQPCGCGQHTHSKR